MSGQPYMPPAGRDDWGTPDWLWTALHREFAFDVDAAASADNALLEHHWTKGENGLIMPWSGLSVYANPPFDSRTLAAFAKKAWYESRQPNTTVVLLVPVKADQQWFHDYAIRSEVRFIRGRIAFKGASGCFPGPCALLIFSLNHGPRMVSMERLRSES